MPAPDLFNGIIQGDEIALRDLYRRYGPAAMELATRIVGEQQAAEIVIEALLLIWSEPQRWGSAALDVHLLLLVRDLALAVRRRGVTPELAALALEPYPFPVEQNSPDVITELKHDQLRHVVTRLPGNLGHLLEDAWIDGTRHDEDELARSLDLVAQEIHGGRLTESGTYAARTVPTADQETGTSNLPLATAYLRLLDSEDRDDLVDAIRTDAAAQRRCAYWPTAAAAMTGASLVIDEAIPIGRVEQRLIQRARFERPPKVRSRRALRAATRSTIWLVVIGLVAVAAVFAYVAFRTDDPISGLAISLSEDGSTGVLLPNYKGQLFALAFWGLPQLEPSETWQVWFVRDSGSVEPGPTFTTDPDGRASVTIDPNDLEHDDTLIGFAISRDSPGQRVNDTPSSDDILYEFVGP